jgi:uncharacterized membrane protein
LKEIIMNEAHIHLLLNHFPIITPILAVLVLIAGFILKSEIIKRVAFALFIFGAIITFPSMATGEGAEEIVEELGNISEKIIHQHEEKAETFAILSYLLGLLSIVGLWASIKGKTFSTMLNYVVLIFSVVTLYFAQQTGTSGGEIRHTEIRSDNISNASIDLDAATESEDKD